ncbi:MAG: addiction module antidote protein, HigA family [Gammaproteobacteria bacterium]|nr:MAG: addiction module antidote protein, HigA family [Gammaproteobacteria bacterium]
MTDRKRQPNHPGFLLREVVLPAMGMSVSQAAREMGVSRQQLHKILAGKRAVTAEMAARLGKYCGNGAELWLSMQSAHDLWKARRSLAGELRHIPSRTVP